MVAELGGTTGGVEIGHAGDVISGTALRRVTGDGVIAGDVFGMGAVVLEEEGDDGHAALRFRDDGGVEVDALEHELAQGVGGALDGRAHGDEGQALRGDKPGGGPGVIDNVAGEGVDAIAVGGAEDAARFRGEVVLRQHAGADGIADVVVEVGEGIGDFHDLAFQRIGDAPGFGEDVLPYLGAFEDGIARLIGEVEAVAGDAAIRAGLQHFDDADALDVVAELIRQALGEGILSGVAEGGVADIVPEGGSFGEVFVQVEGASDGAGDLGDLQRVGEAGDVVIAGGGDEDLGLVFEASEGLAVEDAIAVPLVLGAGGGRRLRALAAAGGGATSGVGGETLFFGLQAGADGLVGELCHGGIVAGSGADGLTAKTQSRDDRGMTEQSVRVGSRQGLWRRLLDMVRDFPNSRQIVFEALLIGSVYLLYVAIRGQAGDREAEALTRALEVVRLERLLGVYRELDVQEWALQSPVFVGALNALYFIGHFPPLVLLAAWLYRTDRPKYTLVRNTFLLSAALGLMLYWLLPTMPPRLLPVEHGFLDTMRLYGPLDLYDVQGSDPFVNEVAAIPSLHFGWAMLTAVGFSWAVGWRWYGVAAAVLWPLATLLIIVGTGNHFVLDAAVGGLVVVVAFVLARWLHVRYGGRLAPLV